MKRRAVRSVAVLIVGAAFGVAVAAQGGAPQGGAAPAAGAQGAGAPQGGGPPGGGRRGGGRGFNLPPLLMETDAFPDGGIVPQKYTGRGGVQPAFKFSNAPQGTVSYAIIFHDIDVALQNGTGDVLHWMAWNIPASANGIPEGKLPEGSPFRVTTWRARVRTWDRARRPARAITTTCSSSTRSTPIWTCRPPQAAMTCSRRWGAKWSRRRLTSAASEANPRNRGNRPGSSPSRQAASSPITPLRISR